MAKHHHIFILRRFVRRYNQYTENNKLIGLNNNVKRPVKAHTHIIMTRRGLFTRYIVTGDRFLTLGTGPKPRTLTYDSIDGFQTGTAIIAYSTAPIRHG